MHCNSCTKMFINLRYCKTNIFKNSKKRMFGLTRSLHCTHSKDYKVNTSLKFKCDKEPVSNFLHMLEVRIKEARRSVLVQVKSEDQFSQFNDYCSKIGKFNKICNYVLPHSKLCFSLVEFKDMEVLSEIQLGCRQFNWELESLPCLSPFLFFHYLPKNVQNASKTNKINNAVTDYGVLPSEQQITNNLIEMETISDQIVKLYEVTKLNDLGMRLRFLTAFQIESALSGILPGFQCLLFGSSVNGCGRLNSDLDLVLNFSNGLNTVDNGQLMYQVKPKYANDRSRLQKHMEIIGDLINNFLPGCNNVIRILQARIPIIKYKHEYTGIDCDLSLTNNNAVTMSKLLYTLSSVDWRVRPLLLTIKHWAEKNYVTNQFPGRWISNFSLSLLVIFYMQQIKIIPSIDHCTRLIKVCDNESNNEMMCTFLHDVIEVFKDSNNETTSLSEILLGFFEYYLKFDFDSNEISINTGQTLIKRNKDEAMYIVNPLEQELNVSKNVSSEEIQNLKIKLTEASDLLSNQLVRGKDDSSEWGLIPLLKSSTLNNKILKFRLSSKTQVKPRLVNISELFGDS